MRKFYSLILSLIVSSIALGQTTNTFNKDNSSFNTAENWSLGHTPLPGENVVIPANKTAKLTANYSMSSVTMRVEGTFDIDKDAFTVTSNNAYIQIVSGGKIIAQAVGNTGELYVNTTTRVFNGGTLAGPQFLNASNSNQWVAGTLASNIKDFTATVVNNSVRVQWAGLANTSFSLERSGDSKSWSSIANFSDASEGRFVYNDIAAISGINYYRLKSLSTDGSVNYSAIKVVHVGLSKASLKVFPNPAVRSLNIYVNPGSEQRKISAILVNRTGQVVAQRVLGASSGMLEFQVSNLPEGSYTLNIKGENGYAESRSVVISRK